MIHYLSTRPHAYPMRDMLAFAPPALARAVAILDYDTAFADPARLGPGAYLFTDLERLTTRGLRAASGLWRRLAGDPGTRLFNHPTRAMRRYEFLRAMARLGVNDFDVYRLDELRPPARYPVFLRREDEHDGPASVLIPDAATLARARDDLLANGQVRDDVIIVEYRETRSPDGLWRKFGAYCVAGRVVPVELIVSDHWIAKLTRRLRTPEAFAEEMDYLNGNPHAAELRAIFAAARIDYGRIDYALADGAIRVWEINTNPVFVSPRGPPTDRRPAYDHGSAALTAALLALDLPAPAAGRT